MSDFQVGDRVVLKGAPPAWRPRRHGGGDRGRRDLGPVGRPGSANRAGYSSQYARSNTRSRPLSLLDSAIRPAPGETGEPGYSTDVAVARSLLGRTSRAKIARALVVLIAVVAALGIIILPLGPDLAQAERSLQGPPTFSFPGERGPAVAHCTHTGLFGLFGSTDACALTFRSGDSYRCRVFEAGEGLGLGMGCATRPFRRG